MKRIRDGLLTLMIIAFVLPIGHALADSGGTNDPNDDAGRLDIKTIGHTNDESSVTFRVEMYDKIEISDVYLINWEFDFNADGRPADACLLLQPLGSTGTLRGSFYGECGPEAWATADGKVIDGSTVEVTLQLIDLVEGGGLKPGEPYSYRVTATDRDRIEDTAPEQALVAHSDVPAPTARRGIADTQLGFAGQNERSQDGGASGGVRPGRTQDTVQEGQTVSAEDATTKDRMPGPLGAIPVIGNLCSGSLCFVLGAGAPIIAAAVFGLVLVAVRRRHMRKGPHPEASGARLMDLHERDRSPQVEPVNPGPDPGPRSYPGNV